MGDKAEDVKNSLVILQDLILASFSLEEVQDLCFHLQVDYDSLPGNSKNSKVRELLLLVLRKNNVAILIDELERVRPGVVWPDPTLVEDVIKGSSNQIPSEKSAAAKPTSFEVSIYGGEVGNVINIDKLEGGLSIGKGS